MTKLALRRARILFIIVLVAFIMLSGRLAYLQILRHDYYWSRSELNRTTKITLPALRGEIRDRHGALLAGNRPSYIVSIMDRGDGYDRETIAYLSATLGVGEEEILGAIQGQMYMRYLPLQLKNDLTPEMVAQVSESRWKLKGVNIEIHPQRYYPGNAVAAHLLGYLGQGTVGESMQRRLAEAGHLYTPGDLVGQTGLEQTWEPRLRGRDGEQLVETNYLGQIISYLDRLEPVPGDNLFLTLDLELQKVAEESLKRRIEALQGRESGGEFIGRATAVVIDPNSGAILAMANQPAFDLNTFAQDYLQHRNNPLLPLNNIAITGTYPIGSTYKMVTGAAVLQEEIWRERDTITCPGVIRLVGTTVECFRQRAHGRLNFFDAMAVSCNIYFYRAGLAAGIDLLAAYARQFGFGSVTGLTDLHGESPGIVASREQKAAVSEEPWFPAETMYAAIGQQDNSITALQLANYVSIIANGGIHYRPYLVQSAIDFEGNKVWEAEPEIIRRADISERTLGLLRESMRRVTQPRGTGWFHLSPLPFTSAGKSGTAEVPGKPPHSLFVGFAPYDVPKIVVAVIVEHGGIGADGGLPVAAEIMEYYFTGTIKGVLDLNGEAESPAD